MIPPDYLALRLARHYLPDRLTRAALHRQILIRPGLETRDPAAAAALYQGALKSQGRELSGAQVFVLGFGGYFGLAVQLLDLGARHVTLCDPYARLRRHANARLAARAPNYLSPSGDPLGGHDSRISVLPLQVRQIAAQRLCQNLDLILSWSVYEHLVDPERITSALSQITAPSGCHVHFIDLRDHFFRHPFEMLCYRDRTWQRWLNPASNLNRWRTWQYEAVFKRHFDAVQAGPTERDLQRFHRVRDRIRPEFLSGDDRMDSATRLMVFAAGPRVSSSPTRPPL